MSFIFIGRNDEIERLQQRINDTTCHLITVMGSGGSGKTRLVKELMMRLDAPIAKTTYFVSLQTLASPERIPFAIADTLDINIQGQRDPTDQLISYLEGKTTLLILDNFEHLMSSQAIALIRDLLMVDDLTVLITSREALSLREEWLMPLAGMPFPTDETNLQMRDEDYTALQLFAAHARQHVPDFSLDDNLTHVFKICYQVEGLPLAIELAASWLRYMSCEQVAANVQDGDSLESPLRNIPERHRSMQTVFDHSWVLMTGDEREALMSLSLFRGSFSQEAAQHIADTTLSTLTALVDQSMLRVHSDGRYYLHELLRQYSKTKLQQHAATYQQVQERFRRHYVDFLAQRTDDMMGHRQLEALAEIHTEADNIRIAWDNAIQTQDMAFFEEATESWSLFYQFKSRYQEGADAMRQALDSLPTDRDDETTHKTHLHLLTEVGWFAIRLGQLHDAETAFRECLKIYNEWGQPPLYGHATDPHIGLGIIALVRGEYQQAKHYGEISRQTSESHQQTWNQTFAYYVLANATLALGDVSQASDYAEQAYHLAEDTQDEWFMAYCLNVRGDVAQAIKDYDTAARYYQRSYHIREAFNDLEGKAVALHHLGRISLDQDNLEQAQQYYQQSLHLYKQIHDRGGLAEVNTGLGAVALAQRNYRQAKIHFHEALAISHDINHLTIVFTLLNHIARLYRAIDQQARSRHLFQLVAAHLASSDKATATARQHLQDMDGTLPAPTVADDTLEDTINQLLDSLAEPPPLSLTSTRDALVDPLTEREVEVLHLLARGMTNRDIADELTIAVGTVKAHNHRIYSKLDVRNRTEAVARARELNLL